MGIREESLPTRELEWCPPGIRNRDRPDARDQNRTERKRTGMMGKEGEER